MKAIHVDSLIMLSRLYLNVFRFCADGFWSFAFFSGEPAGWSLLFLLPAISEDFARVLFVATWLCHEVAGYFSVTLTVSSVN